MPYQQPGHPVLNKMPSNGAPQYSDRLQHLTGMLEVKFKAGAFSTWSDVFVRLEGRWMTVHKREKDATRIAAVELGPGVQVTDLNDTEASTKFPRRFDLNCKGGVLPATELGFRTKSRKDRDLWVLAIATNLHILTTIGLDLSYGIADLEPIIARMKEALTLTPIRIRSDLAIRCASGEDIVAFLVAEQLVSDRTYANIIGRRLLAMNVIHHVVWEKGFVDSNEQYTLSEMDEELGYEVEHFQKYMDSRKFWRFFDSDSSSSNGSSRSGRSGRSGRNINSTVSSSGASLTQRGSATNVSQTSQSHTSSSQTSAASPPDAVAEKKAKHCSVCKKGFNPLRRRYSCRICSTVVCSHCSMSRKTESANEGSGSSRICMSCKLSAAKPHEDFYDRIFTGPSLAATASTSELSSISGGGRASTFSQFSSSSEPSTASEKRIASSSSLQQTPAQIRRKSSAVSLNGVASGRRISMSSTSVSECQFCQNEACGPLKDYFEVPYPASQDVVDSDGRSQYVIANELDNEHARLRSVHILLNALQSEPALKQSLLHLCSMATIAAQCDIALVGLLDSDEYVICAQNGGSQLDDSIPRDKSFAAHTCRNGSPIVCSDLTADIRFAGNAWRRDVLKSSFYAGIPLTLANGHTVGAIEVFDANVRYACTEVVTQLQAVMRGLMKKFEDVIASVSVEEHADAYYNHEYDMDSASVSSIDSSMSVDSKPDTSEPLSETSASVAEAGEAGAAQPTDSEMESRLMELLSQTTTTQEQLRNQQGHMVHAITSHSKQISDLAKQLERMESTLQAKLDGKDAQE
uniref:FYVE-type domain-containing protein n=1 Tax=Globisporangium ultimum (strain ATCC 200006 / CBS 805.95 / DAOM BR144) TaxID=431595 RepID=K3X6I3_GLOUD